MYECVYLCIYVYVTVHLKLRQHCKLTKLQFLKKKLKKNTHNKEWWPSGKGRGEYVERVRWEDECANKLEKLCS